MNAHGTMLGKVQAYLAARHQAGYISKIEAQRLTCFARFTDDSGYRGPLTVEVASRWATASKHARRLTAAHRLAMVRRFARYCLRFDPATEIPPLGLFGPEGGRRLTPPYLYRSRGPRMARGREGLATYRGLVRRGLRHDLRPHCGNGIENR
jgi:hypothetical protein